MLASTRNAIRTQVSTSVHYHPSLPSTLVNITLNFDNASRA